MFEMKHHAREMQWDKSQVAKGPDQTLLNDFEANNHPNHLEKPTESAESHFKMKWMQ